MKQSDITGSDFGGEQSLLALLDVEKLMMERLANRRPLGELLDTLTLALERMAAGIVCTILQLDDSAAGFHVASAPRLPAPLRQALEQADLRRASCSCAAAIRTREPAIITDIEHDARWDELRAAALAAGFRACWAVPMISAQHEVLGALTVYLRERRAPQGFELEVVQHVAFLAGRTIGRKQLDDSLVENEQMFRAIFENEQDSMAIIDPRLETFVTVNPAFEQLFGYSREEASRHGDYPGQHAAAAGAGADAGTAGLGPAAGCLAPPVEAQGWLGFSGRMHDLLRPGVRTPAGLRHGARHQRPASSRESAVAGGKSLRKHDRRGGDQRLAGPDPDGQWCAGAP